MMEDKQFLQLLDQLLELKPGTLTRDSRLEDNGWSSLAAVEFVSLVDEQFDTSVSPNALANCATVNDLIRLLGDRVAAAA